ncbi:MAG: histidinol-phosphate transaminase [Bacteroidetes Order II. Incertae sedis bacterium]|nr:histidinol-phosphate transaminase [Bacteroidetes Order II. bacterium]
MTEATTQPEALTHLIDQIRPTIRAEHAYLVGLEAHIATKLNQNENPYDWPSEIKTQLFDSFLTIPWNRYPNDQPVLLQKAIADYVGLSPDQVLVSNGSNEMMLSIGSVLIGKDAPVVLPTPLFSLYEKIVRLCEGRIISVACRPDFGFDLPAIREAILTNNPILTVIGAPNNPTGAHVSKEDLLEILDLSSGFVLIDEAYAEFVDDGRGMQTALARYPNLLILRTFSKSFALAGIRIGYLLGHPAVLREILKYRIPFMVDHLTERIGVTVLQHVDWMREKVREIVSETQRLQQALKEVPEVIQLLPTKANFMLFKTSLPAKKVMDTMSEKGILLRNMSGYAELNDFLRVNAGTPEENDRFLEAIKIVLRGEQR